MPSNNITTPPEEDRAIRAMPTPLQQVTSLRRREQANAPAASYFCVVSYTTTGAETRRVRRTRGAGGGACNAPLSCFNVASLQLACYNASTFS